MFDVKKLNEPILVLMLRSNTPESLIKEIKSGLENGAEGFCLSMQEMAKEYRTEEYLKPIIDAMGGKVCYITNYRRNSITTEVPDDEELAKEMLTAISCGADIVDVMGDMFLPSADEITYDDAAVEKQKEYIAKIHEMGATALMSSHVLKYLPPDEVLKIAKSQASRGVDIVKIVVMSDTEEQLYSNFEINAMLTREIEQPVLFLSGGECRHKHRIFGPFLSKPNLFLVGNNVEPDSLQPRIKDAKEAHILAKEGR